MTELEILHLIIDAELDDLMEDEGKKIWYERPNPSLSLKTPRETMKTIDGSREVFKKLSSPGV